jgi:hypothetical protein
LSDELSSAQDFSKKFQLSSAFLRKCPAQLASVWLPFLERPLIKNCLIMLKPIYDQKTVDFQDIDSFQNKQSVLILVVLVSF